MKKFNCIISLTVLILVVTGCANNSPEETATSSTVANEVKNGDKESKYVTEDDVISSTNVTQEGEPYILYTFKGGKQVAIPGDKTLEEAKIDLDEIPDPGREYTEDRK